MARLLLMSDFSESYANQLLQGIMRYSHEHEPWVVCKMPLSLRDNDRMNEVVDFAVRWKADAIIGQFRPTDDLEIFKRHGIIPVCQDYQQSFPGQINIKGDYELAGKICADYLIEKHLKNFGFFGIKGIVWSDGRRNGFVDEIRSKVPEATISILEKENVNEAWWYDLDTLTEWIDSLPKPVAILASDDNRAYYIIEASKQCGTGNRIPNDILVLGVDNDESLCQLCDPQLSSLNQGTEEAGYKTAKMIDELLALPREQRFEKVEDITVEPTFITTRRSSDAFIHDNQYISKVMYYINNNLGSHLCVNDIVAQVPMSRRLLESTFRKEMGVSIYQYILQVRTEKMKDLIVNGRTPLEAADELGLDYKIIARSFKKITGMTPGSFAKQQTKER